MNSVFKFSGVGVKLACSKVFGIFKKCIKLHYSEKDKIVFLFYKKILKQHLYDTIQLFRYSIIKRLCAFTLAETLIVMGIIGVVAALTLPNLNSSTGEKEKVAKLQKIYSSLQDAYGRSVAIYGPIDEWYNGMTKRSDLDKKTGERFADFLKVSKVCLGSSAGCFKSEEANYLNINDKYKNINSDEFSYRMILSDGSSIGFRVPGFSYYNLLSARGIGYGYTCGHIIVDIDGPNKGANTLGKDIFLFVITSEGIYPVGMQREPAYGNLKNYCFNKGYCTGWVMESGNMDYLKADGTGKCKNSDKTLSWSVLSCN